jgi:hypothetical protein
MTMYLNMCIWLRKQEKYENKKDKTTITNSRVTSEFIWKMDVFKDAKAKTWKVYLRNLKET